MGKGKVFETQKDESTMSNTTADSSKVRSDN